MLIRRKEWDALLARHGVADAAAACVIRPVNEFLLLDASHPAFPREALRHRATADLVRQGLKNVALIGPGGHLKRLLGRFGIKATEGGCRCTSRAAEMDRNGCEWVEENLDTVVGWLREEAQKRGLPFVDAAGKMLVREAVRRARKDAAANARGSQRQD